MLKWFETINTNDWPEGQRLSRYMVEKIEAKSRGVDLADAAEGFIEAHQPFSQSDRRAFILDKRFMRWIRRHGTEEARDTTDDYLSRYLEAQKARGNG